MMERDRFEALCDAYGGDINRWPEGERDAARTFAGTHPAVAEPLLEAAQALDEVMAHAVTEPPSEALYRRVVTDGVTARTPRQSTWAAAAAAVMLSVGLGAGWIAAPMAGTPTEDVYASAFGAFDSLDTLSLEEDV